MNEAPLRVGIIGADTKASWAKVSHIPAIQGLESYTLAAVATRHVESAKEAAQAFSASFWFADPVELIRSSDVDVVTITVKVPDHRELVMAAINAGKHVYCEAPLARSSEEADELAKSAIGHHVAIGLQSRFNPAVRRAAELVSGGAIGRPVSARVISTTVGFGPVTASPYLYFEEAASGANLLTITAGHTLDLLEAVVGRVTEVDALTPTLWPSPTIVDTGATTRREVPDHAEIIGFTDRGAVFNVTVRGGVAPEHSRFKLEVQGTAGWLSLTGGHPYGVQAGDLTLASSVTFDAPDAPVVSGGFLNASSNVGEVYASLARDIQGGTFLTPGFQHALHNTQLIEAVYRAGMTGRRQAIEG